MKNKHLKTRLAALALLAAAFATTQTAQAHCDSLDGPVVEYTHYVKGIHDAATRAAHGHFPEAATTPADAHPHKK